jgi:hypothetical protein
MPTASAKLTIKLDPKRLFMAHQRALTLAAIFAVMSLFTSQASALFGPSNYSECVLDNLSSGVSIQAVVFLEAECRKQFPTASTSLLTPDSIQECYNKHQDLASSSAVAKAIYRACDDYNYRPSQIPAR